MYFRDSMNGPRGPMAASLHILKLRRCAVAGHSSRSNNQAKPCIMYLHVISNDVTEMIRDNVSGARARIQANTHIHIYVHAYTYKIVKYTYT